MRTSTRVLLTIFGAVVALGIGLVVVGLARADDPTYALFWSTGFSVLFFLAFPLASALATAEVARRLIGSNVWLWGLIGFVFPVAAIFVVAVAGSVKRRRDMEEAVVPGQQNGYLHVAQAPPPPPPPRECAWCGSLIPADMSVCPNCAGRQGQ